MSQEPDRILTAFDWSQLGIQIVGMLALVLTLAVYFGQLRTMQSQQRITESEMAARMRPWVGMFGFHLYVPTMASTDDVESLKLVLRNSDQLPAQKARL